MKINRKRGFTIVELIIVIAVIAIFAAVLIPTFSNLLKRAYTAADQTLVKNLNNALRMDTEVSTHKTMSQALEATKKNGFDVSKINAKATENEIVWDSLNDCFAYIEADKTEVTYIPDSQPNGTAADYQLWVINNDNGAVTVSTKYSTYLAGSVSGAIATSKGLDVGANTEIKTINYTNSGSTQNVVLRTNVGCELTVSAAGDTVDHYGWAKTIAAETVACYNEYGSVGILNVKQGKIVTQANCTVSSIRIDSEATNVTVDVTKSTKEVVYTGSNSGVTVTGTTAVAESKMYDKTKFEQKYSGTNKPEGYVVDTVNKTISISTVDAMIYLGYIAKDLGKNYTVSIMADIDFENMILENGFNLDTMYINGNNHNIKNLYIENNESSPNSLTALFTQVKGIKNLKLDSIHVSKQSTVYANNERASILVGQVMGNQESVIENVTIKNSSVRGGKYTGAVVGYAYGSINSCTIENCTVIGQSQCGAIVGYLCQSADGARTINNNIIRNTTVELANQLEKVYLGKLVGTLDSDCTTGSITHELKNNVFENCTISTDKEYGRATDKVKIAY